MNKKTVENSAAPEEFPGAAVLESVYKDACYHRDFGDVLRNTIFTLVTVIAMALLIATLVLPVIRIYGTSMDPTIVNDSIIMCRKTQVPHRGDVFAFYYNNKIVIRRVIALPGDEVDMDSNGLVCVNGEVLEEDYLSNRSFGDSDLEYPYTVPEGYYFVLADNREGVVDSRSSYFGNIQEEDLIGKVLICVWPLDHLGLIQ